MILRFLALALITSLLPSCTGYKLGDIKPSKLASIQSISVPLFENNTQEQRLASLVTNSVIDEVTRDGTYQTSLGDHSDAELRGKISSIEYRARRYDRFDSLRASEMHINIFVSWSLVDNQNNVLMSGAEEGQSYFTVASNQQTSRNNAFPDAAKDAAEKIVQKIANGF